LLFQLDIANDLANEIVNELTNNLKCGLTGDLLQNIFGPF